MIRCNKAKSLMVDYLDGALSPEDLAALESHLLRCETCWELYNSTTNAAVSITRSRLFAVPKKVAGQLRKRVMARIRAQKKTGPGG